MIGTELSHYKVTGKLGVGGMGVVYEAVDMRLPRRVALKFLPDELMGEPDAARRLRREAETIAVLNHPNICTIHEIDVHEGSSFIVMERLDGLNLKLFMARHTLTTPQIVQIAVQVAQALGAAHRAGIIHRDIKPGNIIIGDALQVKVLDFGLARRFMLPETGEILLHGSTIPGRPVGTPNYMAPERILQGPPDPRSDLFSLGVVIFEMATGRLPFAAESPSETVANVLNAEPTALRSLAPDRPITLERVVGTLLAKLPEDRYESAPQVIEALEQVTKAPSVWRRLFGARDAGS